MLARSFRVITFLRHLAPIAEGPQRSAYRGLRDFFSLHGSSMLSSARVPQPIPHLSQRPPTRPAFPAIMCNSSASGSHPDEPLTKDTAASAPSSSSTPSPAADAPKQRATLWTVPTILTVARLFAIPPVVWLFQSPDPAAASLAAGIFVLASLTDWLDGYLARKMNASTPFGAFLDPVADKLMVGAVLVLLCTKTFESGLFAAAPWLLHTLSVTIISRELAMSSLREWAATLGPAARAVVDVNVIGKYKTTAQMASLAMLLYAMNGGAAPGVEACAVGGPWLLVAATALTVYSFAVYFAKLSKFLF